VAVDGLVVGRGHDAAGVRCRVAYAAASGEGDFERVKLDFNQKAPVLGDVVGVPAAVDGLVVAVVNAVVVGADVVVVDAQAGAGALGVRVAVADVVSRADFESAVKKPEPGPDAAKPAAAEREGAAVPAAVIAEGDAGAVQKVEAAQGVVVDEEGVCAEKVPAEAVRRVRVFGFGKLEEVRVDIDLGGEAAVGVDGGFLGGLVVGDAAEGLRGKGRGARSEKEAAEERALERAAMYGRGGGMGFLGKRNGAYS
jgi:hypothetical protein